MSDLVLRTDGGGLATLTLNRPDKLNALSLGLFAELRTHVEQLATETDRVGVVVVRGAGKCFSAGYDLEDVAASKQAGDPNFHARTIQLLANLPQPVISAVHGHCYTGAMELALAGDLIFAAASAKFADTHSKWALTPVWGMSQRLPRRVGSAKAREMMFTSRTYSGVEAAAMGLANMCVPDEAFEAELHKLTSGMLANSWFTHRANKKLLNDTDGLPLAAGLAHEIYRTEGRGPDALDRVTAFTNKARPT